MSRTIAQIYDEMVAAKDTQAPIAALAPQNDTYQQLLTDLNSSSKVAIWRLLTYIVASAIWFHETLWDKFKAEIDKRIADGTWGTVRWYQNMCFKFQFGDSLTYNALTQKYEYTTIDPTKQIVKRCSISETSNGLLIFKVAKFGSNPDPLNVAETAAFESYLKKIKFAGTWVQVITGSGDLLRIALDITYDPIIPLLALKINVEAAVQEFISSLPFDGTFRIIHLIDAIQQVEGVIDVFMPQNAVQTRLSLVAPYVTISAFHVPNYGYYRIDSSAGNTLVDTLNYVAV